MTDTALEPPMRIGAPVWPEASWIGSYDRSAPPVRHGKLPLRDGSGYRNARFLVRDGQTAVGFVTAPVVDGAVDADELWRRASALPERQSLRGPIGTALPFFSVIIPTRDRPGPLADAVRSVLETDYPDFELIVVDNGSATDRTAEVVRAVDDERVRLVREPRPGASRARNAGVAAARGDHLAFTDDDVVADRWWLRQLAAGFSRGADIGVVCGMVPTGELATPAQAWFDERVTWASNLTPVTYRLADPPSPRGLFPFEVGRYGTGANMAVRRETWETIGGSDVRLGPGTPTKGGEDLDVFLAALAAGYAVAVEPSSVVWHRHRAELSALRSQVTGYGRGLGAWLTKVALHPRLARHAAPVALPGLRHLAGLIIPWRRNAALREADESVGARRPAPISPGLMTRLRRVEMLGLLSGPASYLLSRWRNRCDPGITRRETTRPPTIGQGMGIVG